MEGFVVGLQKFGGLSLVAAGRTRLKQAGYGNPYESGLVLTFVSGHCHDDAKFFKR